MTIATLQTLLRDITNTNSTSYSDTSTYNHLSAAALFLNGEYLKGATDWDFQGTTATANIVASTAIANRYYAFPSNFLKLKGIDLMADGTNWYPCSYLDLSEAMAYLGEEADVVEQFTNTEPYYTISGNKIVILSGTLTSVTNGIRYYFAESIVGKDEDGVSLTAFSAGTDIPSLPEPWQMGLIYCAAKLYFQKYGARNRAIEMDAELEKMLVRVKEFNVTGEKLFLKPVSDLENYE